MNNLDVLDRTLQAYRPEYIYKGDRLDVICDIYRLGYEDARRKYDEDLKKNDIQKWRVSGHP